MKKSILTVLFLIFAAFGFAQSRFNVPSVDINECYDISINVNRLSSHLQLTDEQTEYLQIINECMNQEIMNASSYEGHEKVIKLRKAIDKDVRNMKKVLTDEQFNMYVRLLFETIKNNFINQLNMETF